MQANNIFSIESQELGEEVVVHNFFDIKIMSAYNKVSLDIQDALKKYNIVRIYEDYSDDTTFQNGTKPVWIKWNLNVKGYRNGINDYLSSISKQNRNIVRKSIRHINENKELSVVIVDSSLEYYRQFKTLYFRMLSKKKYGLDFYSQEKTLMLYRNIRYLFIKFGEQIVAGAVFQCFEDVIRLCYLVSNQDLNQKYNIDITKYIYYKLIELGIERNCSNISLGYDYSTFGIGISTGLSDIKYRMGFRPCTPNSIDTDERIEIMKEYFSSIDFEAIYSFEYNDSYKNLKLKVFINNSLDIKNKNHLINKISSIYTDIKKEIVFHD
ncbi:hypothetical protein QM439_02175 [Streptococcus parasanguinis]|uniref:hypothetical protein n=1 Tax=Streptococcus parasanguinis TaxID=1318 RepID=UPI0039C23B2A